MSRKTNVDVEVSLSNNPHEPHIEIIPKEEWKEVGGGSGSGSSGGAGIGTTGYDGHTEAD